jgi:hypothetical protein
MDNKVWAPRQLLFPNFRLRHHAENKTALGSSSHGMLLVSKLNVFNTPLSAHFQLLCKGLTKITPSNMIKVSEMDPILEFIRDVNWYGKDFKTGR